MIEWLIAYRPLIATALSLLLVIFIMIRWRMDAFAALILAAIAGAIGAGLSVEGAYQTITNGFGGTVGFIAVVIGLGALFGTLLEATGAVEGMANRLSQMQARHLMPLLMSAVGLVASIAVFFDVALIILVPTIIILAYRQDKPAIYYGLPLLAGLAVGHGFIPPTPGPIAVAEIVGAHLGWVILLGTVVGGVTVLIAGPALTSLLQKLGVFDDDTEIRQPTSELLSASSIGWRTSLALITLPLILIVAGTISKTLLPAGFMRSFVDLVGHPFAALLIACGAVLWVSRKQGAETRKRIQQGVRRAFEPAGAVILVTGAGGALKQVLVDTGAGTQLASVVAELGLSPLVAGYVLALIVRVAQGSATVAMITAAGLVTPLIAETSFSQPEIALVGLAVAAGATGLSHVNDSGFWLVNRIFNQSVGATLKTWTVMTTVLSVTAFMITYVIFILI